METRIELSSNLEETLRGRPSLVALFLARRMACPGCAMAPFETLADAAHHHGIAGETLLAEVRRAVGDDGGGPGGRPGGGGLPTPPGGVGSGPGRESAPRAPRQQGPAAPRRRGREETS